jgi:hypothetical protein
MDGLLTGIKFTKSNLPAAMKVVYVGLLVYTPAIFGQRNGILGVRMSKSGKSLEVGNQERKK